MDYLQINELYHHGIKGMKWGVRRFLNEDGSLTTSGKARYNSNLTKKNPIDMTDEDLASSSRRLQAEQNYKNLSVNQNAKAAKRIGASVIGSFIAGAGGTFAMEAISKGTMKIGKKKVGIALAVGGVSAASALASGLVTLEGGTITKFKGKK